MDVGSFISRKRLFWGRTLYSNSPKAYPMVTNACADVSVRELDGHAVLVWAYPRNARAAVQHGCVNLILGQVSIGTAT